MQQGNFHRPVLYLCLLLGLLAPPTARAQWLVESKTLMGTDVRVELWAAEEGAGRMAIATVFQELRRLDEMMNPWNPASELARINREAGGGAMTVSPEITEVVQRALYYSRLSHGAFDISFASVGQYYDYRSGKAPSSEQLRRSSPDIDYRSIVLDEIQHSIYFTRPGLQIDLGGIAKGYAVDRAIDVLLAAGIKNAVISAGGDSRILGDLGDRPRTIGIRHPRNKGEYAVMIPLADTAISTSGDYERFFIADGERYHHILNPRTGRSAAGVQSASIITARAIDSDALSTTTFVLGVERGLALINSLPGVDAVIIDGEGKLHYSRQLLLSTKE
jgi:FAD:protein FMN transferase